MNIRGCLKVAATATLLAVLLLAAAGCEDFTQYPGVTPTTTAPPETVEPPKTSISTADRATLAVYEHLLSQAASHEAQRYLAGFYAASDNWSATMERFKDGSTIWYVTVDMTAKENWELRPYWQQAGWFVYRDGQVIPSQRLQANALRIEADLKEMN